jgi:hypothetical protein
MGFSVAEALLLLLEPTEPKPADDVPTPAAEVPVPTELDGTAI